MTAALSLCFYFLRARADHVPPLPHRNVKCPIPTRGSWRAAASPPRRSLLISPSNQWTGSNKDPQSYSLNFLSTFFKRDLSEVFLVNLMKALDTLPRKMHTPQRVSVISAAL